jgi:F-type H+-transporting ATPase subunit c
LLSIALLVVALPAFAYAEAPAGGGQAAAEAAVDAKPDQRGFSIYMGVAFGCGMVIIGAAYGISKIGSCAVESMARQPEVAAQIQTAMIVSAALIEGATFFALIVCWVAK